MHNSCPKLLYDDLILILIKPDALYPRKLKTSKKTKHAKYALFENKGYMDF